MLKLTSFVFSLLISATIFGQTAPDFTITDTDGNTHTLYADYLDQGKTVLIKVFFTNCPPCNIIAPLVEDLYQDWGAGNNDVEFFELSDKGYDMNTDVAAYKQQHGLTFIAAGSDGGSTSAVSVYKDGTYGTWLGTPCFVVISPDGTVQYNVANGSGQTAINNIDAAIAATGAVKPNVGTTPVIAINGTLSCENGNPIAGVNVALIEESSLSVVASSTSASDGKYDLLVNPSDTTLQYSIQINQGGIAVDGVTTLDIVHVRKHLLGITPFTNNGQYISSDVNFSNTVTASDILKMRKIILGIDNGFNNDLVYKIYPSDLPFGEGFSSTLPNNIAVNSIGAQTINIGMTKLGDLNNSDPICN